MKVDEKTIRVFNTLKNLDLYKKLLERFINKKNN